MSINKRADKAQIESEDVAAVNVFKTGERDISARKINIDDFVVFTPADKRKVSIINEESTRIRTVGMSVYQLNPGIQQLPSNVSNNKTSNGKPHQHTGIKALLFQLDKNSKK